MRADVADSAVFVRTMEGRRRQTAERMRTVIFTLTLVAVAIAFLSPLVYSALTSLKTPEQITQPNSPVLPSDPATYEYEGESYDVYYVPLPDGSSRELALVRKGRQ
ncbi:MAG TPA: hypothetical protein VFT20_09760, partial [Candidatus Limnocylindrales bacterium]|nr:hypothetical protein [Candidatus Limnocylindrales bacterium]